MAKAIIVANAGKHLSNQTISKNNKPYLTVGKKPTGKEIVEQIFPYIEEKLSKNDLGRLYHCIDTALSEYASHLLQQREADRWVKVEGKNFPPDNDKYYYWLHSESIDNYESGYYDFDDRCFYSSTHDRLFHVTHWQLPTPPAK